MYSKNDVSISEKRNILEFQQSLIETLECFDTIKSVINQYRNAENEKKQRNDK